jgi:hypothetical protein
MSGMATALQEVTLPFSPFYAIPRDGVDRLMDFVSRDPFTFVVNREKHESTVLEAISLSPIVHESLRSNPLRALFEFPGTSITSKDFGDFLDFTRSRGCVALSRDRILSFVSISGQLGNDCLAFALFSSVGSGCGVDGAPIAAAAPASAADFLTGDRDGYFDPAAVDRCAAKLSSYSVEELRLLDDQTLHRLLSSERLVVESEDALLRLLVALDVNRSEFFGHIEVSFLSMEGLSLFLSKVKFDDLCEEIWSQVICRLKGDASPELRRRRYHLLLESFILQRIPRCLEEFLVKRWTLLYRGSRDGFGAANFHGRCNGQSNTVTVIETTKGFVFGGFTPLAWDSTASYKADSSRKTFLFTVKNSRGSEGRKFVLTNPENAIYGNGEYGPTFGCGHDIHVANGCNGNANSYTNLGRSFTNDTGIDGKEVLIGAYNFTVKEIEDFAVDS